MFSESKYLIFGAVPVSFTEEGYWYVDVDNDIARRFLSKAVVALLKVNSAAEAATLHQVRFSPPMKPVTEGSNRIPKNSSIKEL